MSGVDRLRTLAGAWDEWGLGGTLADVADQIERELCEAAAWVREHGGIEVLRRMFQDADSRRVELCGALGIDLDKGWSEAMAAMRLRLMPKVLDADGVEIRVGERVRSKWSHDGWWYVVTRVESPGKISLKAVKDGSETVLNAANLTHRDSVFDADGEPCEVGDAVWWTRNLAGSFRIIRIEQDGKCAIRDDDPDEPCGMTVPAGQLTHRAPVIAADGKPLREGETVWDTSGKRKFKVLCFGSDAKLGEHTVKTVGIDSMALEGWSKPNDLTHQRPVLDADGVPIHKGDTVYEVEGTGHAYKVVGIRVGDGDPLTPTVVTCDVGDGTSEHFLPSQLTHERPVSDTWERVMADAESIDRDLRGFDGDVSTCADLVRRAKKLAGVGE